jgi:hypothetical protein
MPGKTDSGMALLCIQPQKYLWYQYILCHFLTAKTAVRGNFKKG